MVTAYLYYFETNTKIAKNIFKSNKTIILSIIK